MMRGHAKINDSNFPILHSSPSATDEALQLQNPYHWADRIVGLGVVACLFLYVSAGCTASIRSRDSRLNSARQHLANEEFQDAETILRHLLREENTDQDPQLHLLLGKALKGQGRLDNALSELKKAHARGLETPTGVEALHLVAEVTLRQGHTEQAIDLFRETLQSHAALLESDPTVVRSDTPSVPTESRLLLAEALINMERYDQAMTELSELRGSVGTPRANYQLYYLSAWVRYAQGDSDEALRLLQKTATFRSDALPRQVAEAESLWATILLDMELPREAVQHLVRAFESTDDTTHREDLLRQLEPIVRSTLTARELRRLSRLTTSETLRQLIDIAEIERLERQGLYDEALQDATEMRSRIHSQELQDQLAEVIARIERKKRVDSSAIGFIAPLTGRLAQWGERVKSGVEFAVSEHNRVGANKSIQLHVADTESDPSRAGEGLRQLIEDHRVIAVIGPVLSQSVLELAELATTEQIVVFSSSASAAEVPESSPYVFRHTLTNSAQSERLADFATTKLRVNSVAILRPSTNYGQELSELFAAAVQRHGGAVVHTETYGKNATDFQPQLQRIETASPEALFIPDIARRVGLLAPQIRFYGMTSVVMLGANAWNDPELIKVAGEYVESSFFVDGFFAESSDPHVRRFVSRYRSFYGQPPDRIAAEAFDTARLVLRTLEEGAETREEVRDSLIGIEAFEGVTGRLSVGEDGEVQSDLFVLSVEDGEIIRVE